MLKIENKRCFHCGEVENLCECDYEQLAEANAQIMFGIIGFILGVSLLIALAVVSMFWASILV